MKEKLFKITAIITAKDLTEAHLIAGELEDIKLSFKVLKISKKNKS